MEVSNRDGKSFYGFVSETLEQALKAYAGGLSLEEMVNFYELMDIYSGHIQIFGSEGYFR